MLRTTDSNYKEKHSLCQFSWENRWIIHYLIRHRHVDSRFERRQWPKRKVKSRPSGTTNVKCSLCSSLKTPLRFVSRWKTKRSVTWAQDMDKRNSLLIWECYWKSRLDIESEWPVLRSIEWKWKKRERMAMLTIFADGLVNFKKNIEEMFRKLSKTCMYHSTLSEVFFLFFYFKRDSISFVTVFEAMERVIEIGAESQRLILHVSCVVVAVVVVVV